MQKKMIYPLRRERILIFTLLFGLAAFAWVILVWQSITMSGMKGMGLTGGMDAPLFIAVWIVMMVATMFPAEAPMVLMFAQIYASKREYGQPFVPTWIFVGSYLVVWTLFGVLAYAVALGADFLGAQSAWLIVNASRLGGCLIVVAGLYQLSPFKNSCLSKCRSPMNFILNSWREGRIGSFYMGLKHGWYCLWCCWAQMIILFPLGMMNVAAMAVIALLIFAEKTAPIGEKIVKIAAVVLIVYGILVILVPGLLPTAI